MTKKCRVCGGDYRLTGGAIGLADGTEKEFSSIEFSLKLTDNVGNVFYENSDICPDCFANILAIDHSRKEEFSYN